MQTVYRVEAKENGKGFYSSGGAIRYQTAIGDTEGTWGCLYNPYACPGPNDPAEEGSFSGLDVSEYHFGFVSLDQLTQWLRHRPGRIALAADHHIVLYDVGPDNLRIGKRQCIFLKDRATKRGIMPLDSV